MRGYSRLRDCFERDRQGNPRSGYSCHCQLRFTDPANKADYSGLTRDQVGKSDQVAPVRLQKKRVKSAAKPEGQACEFTAVNPCVAVQVFPLADEGPTFEARSIASRWSASLSSRPSRKRWGMPESPVCAPTSAPVRIARAWFSPPPFTAWSTADSKSFGKRAVR